MIFDQATDGVHVIFAMLVVGLVVLLTIVLGDLVARVGHRRADRKTSARSH